MEMEIKKKKKKEWNSSLQIEPIWVSQLTELAALLQQ